MTAKIISGLAKYASNVLTGVRRYSFTTAPALCLLLSITSPSWGQANRAGGTLDLIRLHQSHGKTNAQSWDSLSEGGHTEKWIQTQRKYMERFARRIKNHFEDEWRNYDRLSPEKKGRIKKKFRQWKSLPPERRKVLRLRMKRLRELPPEDRALFRRRFHQWKGLSPEDREKIRQKLEIWNSLPPQEQDEIRRKFHVP